MPYTTKLVKKETVAEGTMAFYFEKPAGFEFKAGNSLDWTLINPPLNDSKGHIRPFSIIAAPHEDYVGFATRMRDSAFKNTIKEFQAGSEIQFDGPFGDFTLHNKAERPAVFLVGGIGITPFYSMIKDAAQKKLPHQIYLFYSNRRPEDTAFLKELLDLQKENPNYHLIATMTDMSNSKEQWTGETGYIYKEMLEKHLKNLDGPVYYMAGPPAMVKAMREMLNGAGVNDDDIKTEEFSGY